VMQQASKVTGGFINPQLLKDLASLPSVRGISDALGFTDTDTHGMSWMDEARYQTTHFAAQSALLFFDPEMDVARVGATRVSRVGAWFEVGEKSFETDFSSSRAIAALHVSEARSLLRDAGLNPVRRNRIIRSFDLETFRVEHVTAPKQVYRVFDDFEAKIQGRYVSSGVLQGQTNRIVKFALPNNSATRLARVDIPEGATIFSGKVAPQLQYDSGLVGGEQQIFLTGHLDQYNFEEILMPRETFDLRGPTNDGY